MFKQFMIGAGLTVALGGTAQADTFTGAGATFPAPVYSAWAQAYRGATHNELNYQAIGSGGGIRQIQAKTVDFGATDKPLKQQDLDKAGLSQFPTVVGGIVPIVNLPGVNPGQLKLTGDINAKGSGGSGGASSSSRSGARPSCGRSRTGSACTCG